MLDKAGIAVTAGVGAILGGLAAKAQAVLQAPATFTDALVPVVAIALVGSLVQNWRLSVSMAEIKGELRADLRAVGQAAQTMAGQVRDLERWSSSLDGEIRARWSNQETINSSVADFKDGVRQQLGGLEVRVSGLSRFPGGREAGDEDD